MEPVKFFVHRHIQPQYACRHCETITAAPVPPALIDGGMTATGLLSGVVISKFLDHLPLCTDWNKSPPATESFYPVPRWPVGSVNWVLLCSLWQINSLGICGNAIACMRIRDPGAAARSGQGKNQKSLSVGLSQQRLTAWPEAHRLRLPSRPQWPTCGAVSATLEWPFVGRRLWRLQSPVCSSHALNWRAGRMPVGSSSTSYRLARKSHKEAGKSDDIC
jgi:hypothetical protein